jgi:hypothetical protein
MNIPAHGCDAHPDESSAKQAVTADPEEAFRDMVFRDMAKVEQRTNQPL